MNHGMAPGLFGMLCRLDTFGPACALAMGWTEAKRTSVWNRTTFSFAVQCSASRFVRSERVRRGDSLLGMTYWLRETFVIARKALRMLSVCSAYQGILMA